MKWILFIFFGCYHLTAIAQTGKFDRYFILGTYNSAPDSLINPCPGGLTIDFISGVPRPYRKDRYMDFDSDIAIISNDTGKLLFYTNGVYINDARDQKMLNGDSINLGMLPYYPIGSFLNAASVIIPMPDEQYYLFHTDLRENKVTGHDQPFQLLLSKIDMKLNDGYGAVTQKRKVLFEGNNWDVQGLLSTTRHANGRDWWVVTNTFPYNKYMTFLVTPDSVYGPSYQTFGTFDNSNGRGNGGLVFSPDGTKLAYSNIFGGIVFFDFDRCTGTLSNYRKYPLGNIKVSFGHIHFSPNSRFLYLSNSYNLYQFDTEVEDIYSSKIHIDSVDGFGDPIKSYFYTMVTAMDGKIYLSSTNGTSHFHVIHNPNEKGKACNFKQHDLYSGGVCHGFGMPHYPNYRLGALRGSPCDTLLHGDTTLVFTKDLPVYQLALFPNPATDRLTIEVTLPHYDEKTELVLCDLTGKELIKTVLPDYAYIGYMDVSQLSAGMYILQLRQRGRVLKSEKVVVER